MINNYTKLSSRSTNGFRSQKMGVFGRMLDTTGSFVKTSIMCVLLLSVLVSFGHNSSNGVTNSDKNKKAIASASVAPVTTCANAIPLSAASLPITAQALVCGTTNDLSSTTVPTACGAASNSYKGGNESLYTLTPTTSGSYTISIAGQTWTSIFVYAGCPTAGGTCVNSVGTSASSKSLAVTLTAGIQYYIWFDTWPTPNSPCPGTFSITPPSAPSCVALPTSPSNNSTGFVSGVLTWPAAAGSATNYTISYGTDLGASNIQSGLLLGNVTTYTIPQALTASTVYYWKVVPSNVIGTATSCATWSFTTGTPPSCSIGLTPINGATNVARNPLLSWTATAGATSYDVYYSTTTPAVFQASVTTTSYTVPSPLLANTSYYYKVVAKNVFGAAVGCTEQTFTTGTSLNYCTPIYTSGKTSGDLISNIAISGTTLSNNTGTAQTNPAYTYFTGQPNYTATLQAGSSYNVNVTVGTWGNQAIKAWVDYNDNGVFEASEVIGTTIIAPGQGLAGPFPPASFAITLSCNPPLGQHRMRVRSVWNVTAASIDPCASAGFGETEDYDITISAADPCPKPTTLAAASITNTSASLSWVLGCAETNWEVAVQLPGAPNATAPTVPAVAVTSSTYVASGLAVGTNHEFFVRAVCVSGSVYSSWSGPFAFSTLPNLPGCGTNVAPANGATNLSLDSGFVAISWTAPAVTPSEGAAASYDVYGGTTSGALSLLGNTTATTFNITGLAFNSTFFWRIIPRNVSGVAVGPCTEWSFSTAGLPANDICSGAISLDALTSPITGSTTGLTNDFTPSCNISEFTTHTAPDSFYSISVLNGYTLNINQPTNSYDSVHSVFFGSCASQTAINCIDDADETPVTWTNNTGTTQTVYWVQDGYVSNFGTFSLAWTLTPPPVTVTSFDPAFVCGQTGGSTVTITGSNFVNVTSVKFYGIEATSFNVVNATTITAVVPAGDVSGPISVTSAPSSNGTGTSTALFEARPFPPSVATTSNPVGINAICGTGTIALENPGALGVWNSTNPSAATVLDGLVTGVNEGTTNITYTVTDNGCASVANYPITVSNPIINVINPINVNAITGSPASFTISAEGTIVSYQWQVYINGDGPFTLSNGAVYSGVDSPVLSIPVTTEDMNNNQYFCLITGVSPCTNFETGAAILKVGNTGIITNPISVNLCNSGQAQFTVFSTGVVESYVWYEDNGFGFGDPIVNGGDFSGATTATLTVSNVTTTNRNGFSYYVVVNGPANSPESGVASINVSVPASITTSPSNQTVCYSGGSVTFTAAASNALGYQWQFSTVGGSNDSDWTTITSAAGPTGISSYGGFNTATLEVNTNSALSPSGTYFYRAIAVSGAPCPNAKSGQAQLLINNPNVAISAPGSIFTYCSPGGASVVLTASGTGSYLWSTGETTASISVSPLVATTYTVTGTTAGCSKSVSQLVTVSGAIVSSISSSAAEVCPNAPVQLNVLTALVTPPTTLPTQYSFSANGGTYTPLISPIVLGTQTGTGGASSLDDLNFNIALPFDFSFAGTNYTAGTTIFANTNGFVAFGASAPITNTYGPIGSANVYDGAISALGADLYGGYAATGTNVLGSTTLTITSGNGLGYAIGAAISGTGIPANTTVVSTTATTVTISQPCTSGGTSRTFTGQGGEVSYKVLGASPNRQLVIQYTKMRRFSATLRTQDFQIILNEFTKEIHFVYGNIVSGGTTTTTYQVGLRGATNSNYLNRTTTTNWSATTAGTSNTSSMTFGNTTLPANGLTYKFTPITPSVQYAWSSSNASETIAGANTRNPIVNPSVASTTYTVVVTSLAGCSDTKSVTVTTDSGVRNFVPPVAQTYCAGQTATLAVSASGPGLQYQWFKVGSPTVVGTAATLSIANATVASSGDYYIVVTPACGAAVTSNPATLTVNPLPTATLTGTVAVCQNDAAPSVTFTGAAGTAPYTFTYSLNGAADTTITSLGNTATIVIPTGTAATYAYVLKSVSDSSATACSQTQSGTATVTVNALPDAPVLATVAPICAGTALNLTATVTSPSPTILTQDFESGLGGWSVVASSTTTGTGNVSLANFNIRPHGHVAGIGPLLTFNSPGGANFLLADSDGAGSSSTVNTKFISPSFSLVGFTNATLSFRHHYKHLSLTQSVELSTDNGATWTNTLVTYNTTQGNETTFATATISLNTFIGQSNVKIRFNYADGWAWQWAIDDISISGTPAPYAFAWSGPNSFSSAVQNPTITNATPAATGSYTLQITNSKGCKSSASVSAIVNPLPTATISGTVAVCHNDATPSVTFTGANATAPYTFTYSLTNVATNVTTVHTLTTTSGNSATVVAPTNVVGIFVYDLLSVQDSSSTACGQAQSGSATVTVNPLPLATIAGSTPVCQNDTAPLVTFTGANGTAPYTFTYKLNGGGNQTVVSSGNTATVAQPTGTAGTFTYTLISVQDSSSATCSNAQTGTVTIIVHPTPTVAAVANQTYYSGFATAVIQLTGTPSGVTFNISGGAASGLADVNDVTEIPSFIPTATPSTVTITPFANGCFGVPVTYQIAFIPVIVNITSNVCGSVNNGLNNQINCNSVSIPGYTTTGYQFEVTNTATGEVSIVFSSQHHFKLTNANNYAYGTTFTIRVAAVLNGQVQGYFGNTCSLTTASVQTSRVVTAQCGSTLVFVNSTINANSVSSTNLYRFRVALASAPTVTYLVERTVPNFKLTDVVGLPLLFNTEYLVDVQIRVKLAGFEAWSQYGVRCSIFTPEAPETSLVNSQCEDYAVPSTSTQINAIAFPGATAYSFRLTGYDEFGDVNYQQTVTNATASFTLSQFSGLAPETTYTVAVSMELFGVFTAFGKDCSIITPAITKQAIVAPFQATAYPNPFAANFMIAVKTTSDSVIAIKVYDMVGRLVEQKSVTVAQLENAPIGNNYPSGVYNVVVTQDETVQTVRVVKR